MFASSELLSSRSSGVRLEDLVAVPVDVGKHSAMAKVIDFNGAELVKPFEFPLDRCGVKRLVGRTRSAMTVCPSRGAFSRIAKGASGWLAGSASRQGL